MNKEFEDYLNKNGIKIIDLKTKYHKNWDEDLEYKRKSIDDTRREVVISDLEGYLFSHAPEDIQNVYFRYLILEYGFLNQILRIKKQKISLYTYHDFLHLRKKFTLEDGRLLAQLHSVLVYRGELLPVRVKGVLHGLLAQMIKKPNEHPLLIFKDEYENYKQKAEDFEVYDWKELSMPRLN